MSDRKKIEKAINSDIEGIEQSVAKLLSMFTEQYGVVVKSIEVESGPMIWNEGKPQYDYRVKFKTTL